MTAPPSGTDPLPDDSEGPREEEASGSAASSPEEARAAAEEALAQVEALADLDESPDPETEGRTGGGAPSDSAQEGAEAKSSGSSDKGRPKDQCENCGAMLNGPYCSQCGQKAANRIVPVWHMINEALEAVFELDLRVFRTFPKFVFLPGRLTKEYINGRRKRYIRPFRLCLFATFLLFAVIALTTTGDFGFILDPQGRARVNPPNTAITLGPVSSSPAEGETSIFGDPERRKKLAEELRSDSTAINIEFYNDPEANERMERVLRTKMAQAVENPWNFVGSLIDRGPYLMFLMLPIFALLLKLLYVRRGRLYVEHVIFSLHIHAFAFFAFTIGILLDQSEVGWVNTAATMIEVSPLVYLVLAMSHVYEQGLIKSTLKAWILLLVYSFVLTIGFLVLLFVVVLFM